MANRVYPQDTLNTDEGQTDNGTMPDNVQALENALVGHRIVKAETGFAKYHGDLWENYSSGLILTLDTGQRWIIADTLDCCAYTELEKFLLHPENIAHTITSVETQDGWTKWFILADMAHVLDLDVSWSSGNPFYYCYGFDIAVVEDDDE